MLRKRPSDLTQRHVNLDNKQYHNMVVLHLKKTRTLHYNSRCFLLLLICMSTFFQCLKSSHWWYCTVLYIRTERNWAKSRYCRKRVQWSPPLPNGSIRALVYCRFYGLPLLFINITHQISWITNLKPGIFWSNVCWSFWVDTQEVQLRGLLSKYPQLAHFIQREYCWKAPVSLENS